MTARPTDGAAASDLQISRADAWQDQQAMALLLTGSTLGGGAAAERFRGFARRYGYTLDQLWIASLGTQRLAAALVVPSPGRTGLLLLSPLERPGSLEAAIGLLEHVRRVQDPEAIRILQAMLEIPAGRQGVALSRAGFAHLAELVYMERAAGRHPEPLVLPAGLEAARWSEARRDLFGRAILASYVDSRDCPGLLGLRAIEDVLAGHMASGRFRPDEWHVVFQGDEPAAVMLLNESQTTQGLDLVYMGVSPGWRRCGLGRRLLRYAIGQARVLGFTSLTVAVDGGNEPAVALYTGEGFSAVARKTASIVALP